MYDTILLYNKTYNKKMYRKHWKKKHCDHMDS